MIQDIAPHKLHNEFHPGRKPVEGSLLFCFSDDGKLLVKLSEESTEEENELVLPVYGEAVQELERLTQKHFTWLFTLDEKDCFWVKGEISLPGYEWHTLRELRSAGYGPRYLFFAAYTAQQLVDWYKDNVWCGRCGGKTIHSQKERALICPSCSRTIYPRINPAVIVAVLDPDPDGNRENDRIVLTKYAGRHVPYFALIAGFTEIGETVEETVHREVMEEVGLKVKNLRYYKSQPWAMADDILMGFYCEVDGEKEIKLDRSELKEGGWYTRDEVILQPDDYSLTNEMMTRFKVGEE